MENMSEPLDKVNNWVKGSVTLKLVTITILMLLLLIPAAMVQSVIEERQLLNDQAHAEVSRLWAERQEIAGPVLTVPVVYEKITKGTVNRYTKNYYLLPDLLEVSGTVNPTTLKRGIYDVVVYDSKLTLTGTFNPITNEVDKQNLKRVAWEQAYLTMGISDLRGIQENIQVKWNDQLLAVRPGSRIRDLISSGVTVEAPISKAEDVHHFNLTLSLQGSENLSFMPLGSTTRVKLESPWSDPSFNGNFIPDNREVTDTGFTADWQVLQINRNFPQAWMGDMNFDSFHESVFGVDLIVPLDDYQKAMRSAKYAVMTISLTFLIFFLVEIINKRKIHPFQYALVGFALCLFYILLVSISEHLNFNLAYLISMVAVVSMITLYSVSVFKVKRSAMMLMAALTGIYAFLFVTMQLADYALLMGSVGLMIILAATMYYTRNINWYKLSISAE